jgi:hypothetical protein
MPERTIEDRLRQEYFDLLPEIQKIVWQLETEVRFHTLPTLHQLAHHEKLIIKSRWKDCESAVKALRRRQEGGTFDREQPEKYSILSLPDLAGVRVLVFPRNRLIEVDEELRNYFVRWSPDPVVDRTGTVLAHKYFGFCNNVSSRIPAEYQVVPMLIGLFWEVEHSAMYKPPPKLKEYVESEPMQALRREVESTLLRFEAGFEASH